MAQWEQLFFILGCCQQEHVAQDASLSRGYQNCRQGQWLWGGLHMGPLGDANLGAPQKWQQALQPGQAKPRLLGGHPCLKILGYVGQAGVPAVDKWTRVCWPLLEASELLLWSAAPARPHVKPLPGQVGEQQLALRGLWLADTWCTEPRVGGDEVTGLGLKYTQRGGGQLCPRPVTSSRWQTRT